MNIRNKTSKLFWQARHAVRRRNAVTMGVQAAVFDKDSRVLLVRHGYRPGWYFPGGGLELGETSETALRRELHEEVGVKLLDRPKLFGIYSHFDEFPGDHILLYLVIDKWVQDEVPAANFEIQEQGFFELTDLPSGTSAATRCRLDEIVKGGVKSETW